MVSVNLLKKVKELPKVPGVYLYKDKAKKIIYVGKAKSLRDRVGSYFLSSIPLGSKTESLVQNIEDLSFIEVQSELEALILEAELIKRYKPRFNINLKDDKSYKYILIEHFNSKENFSAVVLGRQQDIKKSATKTNKTYGPFPDSTTVKDVLKSLRRVISFRDCSEAKFQKYRKINSPCLYGHINLCPAPCVGKISVAEYNKRIRSLDAVLKGKIIQVIKNHKHWMNYYSNRQDYEQAAYYRDIIKKYEYISQRFKSAGEYIVNPNLVEDQRDEALQSLVLSIPVLKAKPERIECFDIANISGKDATASMVVNTMGKLNKAEYKRFRIKTKETPDDYWMLREALERRFSDKNIGKGWALPGLLVIDGGKGQLSVALSILKDKSLHIPVVGLAKRLETIVYSIDSVFHEVALPKDNPGIRLLMELRDEAHRFARKYHHLLRKRSLEAR